MARTKKKWKSIASRNKSSALSLEYQSRESSDEGCESTSGGLVQQKRKRFPSQEDQSEIWQNPTLKTELSIPTSRSDDSEQTDQVTLSEAQTIPQNPVKIRNWFAAGLEDEIEKGVKNENPEPAGRCPLLCQKKKPRHRGPPVDSALVIVHNQMVELESRFQKDLHELEKSYITNHYSPLIKLRKKLLEAAKALNSVKPRPENCKQHAPVPNHRLKKRRCCDMPNASAGPLDIHVPSCKLFEGCAEVFKMGEQGSDKWSALKKMLCRISHAMNQNLRCKECHPPPHKFWYYVFQRSDAMLSSMLTKCDAVVLSFLRDVRVKLFSTSWPDCAEFLADIGARKQHAPFTSAAKSPHVSARTSVSLPENSTTTFEEENEGSKIMQPSMRPMRCCSETTTSCATGDKTIDYSNTLIGFELEFEFFPNKYIANCVLRKRYLFDVRPQEEDFVAVKKYKTFLNPQDTNSKVDSFTSDGGDELSGDNSEEESCPKRKCGKKKSLKKNKCCYNLLDYRGPRLVAIEGSTVKWKSKSAELGLQDRTTESCKHPCQDSADISAKTSTSAETTCPKSSFLDFFGWNWDVYRNRIMANNAQKSIGLTSAEVSTFVTRDYEVGSYIRDTVIPRAFAIYRSCKQSDCKPIDCNTKIDIPECVQDSVQESVQESVSDACCLSEDSNEESQDTSRTNLVCERPPRDPTLQVETARKNLARDYNDVDDVIEDCYQANHSREDPAETLPETSTKDSDNLTKSRRKITDLVRNVNIVIQRANARCERPPGAPLTCPIDSQVIPEVCDTASYRSDDQSRGAICCKRGQTDSKDDGSEAGRSPCADRALRKVRAQLRRHSCKKKKKNTCRRRAQRRCIADETSDDVACPKKKEKVCSNKTSVRPCKNMARIDDTDIVSSSSATEIQGVQTPVTSEEEAPPNLCPCDLHLIGKAGGKRERKNSCCGEQLLRKRQFGKSPLCSMGQDILTDQKLREEYAKENEENNKKNSIKKYSSSDSEAPPPPPPDQKTCKQQ